MAYRGFSFKHGGTVASMWLCIQGFMQSIGWELYDDIASNIKVYRSNGESGNEHYGYVYMQQEATYIAYRFFQYWDLSAHVGYREQVMGGTSTQRLGTFDTRECLLCGDKDIVAIIYPAESNAANSSIWFGHIPNRFDRVTYADGTAGTSATISVASTSGLYEGKQIQILGAGTEGCENLDIIEMVDASTVIVRKMSKDYGTGAVIGVPASTFGCANPYWAAQKWYPTTHISDLGTAVQSTQYYSIYPLLTPAVATVQHHFSKKGAPGPLYFVSDLAGTTGCMVGFSLKYFQYARNVTQTWDACIYNTSGEYGTSATASTSTANTLIETGRTWSADQHLNRMVLITAGTNIGQCAKITGNDATSLSIDGTWGTTFGTSRYQICDQLFRSQIYSLYNYLQLRVTDTTAPVLT